MKTLEVHHPRIAGAKKFKDLVYLNHLDNALRQLYATYSNTPEIARQTDKYRRYDINYLVINNSNTNEQPVFNLVTKTILCDNYNTFKCEVLPILDDNNFHTFIGYQHYI
jgi:hypothetical protein